MNIRSYRRSIVALACLLTSQAGATTLYQEGFSANPYTAGTWEGLRWDGATLQGAVHNSAPHDAGWNSGNPFNAGAGYIYVQHTGTSQASDYLLNTAGALSINPDIDYQSLYVRWNSNQTGAENAVRRFAVEVDDVWYVATTPVFLHNTDPSLNYLDFFGATWNAVSGTDLSVDTASSLTFADLFSEPDDVITGLGFLVEDMPAAAGATRTVRFDNLTLTSGLLWVGSGGAGGDGTWSGTQAWITGPDDVLVEANWANHETAIFGHAYDVDGPGTVTVTGNVIARSLEFYENADGYVLQGNAGMDGSGVPTRVIQISNATTYRSIYVAPDVNVTVGGDAATGLRIYRAGATSPMHIYGGGTLTIDLNGMVRTEGGGSVIVNDGSTVVVKTGGQFNASRDLYIGGFLDTQDGSSGDAQLILDGGSVTTRTGGVGGDLVIGGPAGSASVTVQNNGALTTHSLATYGVRFEGTGIINLQSGGVLSTRKIGKSATATGTATLRFDGGKIVVNNSPAGGTGSLIGTDIDFIYVGAGGAIIDTNGVNSKIDAPLRHDPDGPAIDGGLTKLGAGDLTLGGGTDNTYNGVITIKQGKLITPSFNELGDAANDPANLVLDGGTWEHRGGASTNRGITVTANGGTLAGGTAWRINGQVVGAADSTLYIAGNAWLSGNSASTFHGEIDVLSHEFLVRRATSLGSTQGGVTVRSGATFSLDNNGTGGPNFSLTETDYADDLLLKEGGRLRNRGQTNLNNVDASYSGHITLEGPGHSEIEVMDNSSDIVTLSAPDLIITGGISGAGSLTKTGAGRLILASDATYTGKTSVNEGTLVIRNAGFQAGVLSSPWIDVASGAHLDVQDFEVSTVEGAYTFAAGATLSGGGAIHGNTVAGAGMQIKIGGTSTGNQGLLNLADAGNLTGTLTFDGDFNAGDSTVFFQLGGTTQGVDYDFLDIEGELTFTGDTSLKVSWVDGFVANFGDVFDLVDWLGLPETGWGEFTVGNLDLSETLPALAERGLYWDTSQFLTNGTITAVPEPSRALLLTFALTGLFLRRRRLLAVSAPSRRRHRGPITAA